MNLYAFFCLLLHALGKFHSGQTEETLSRYEIHGSSDKSGKLLITIFSQSKGWFAFGIGSDMTNAAITAVWQNSTRGYVISDRISTGRKLPAISARQGTLLSSNLAVPKPIWASQAVTIVVPVVVGRNQEYIYAYGDDAVEEPDRYDSAFMQHDDFDQAGVIDLTV